MTAMYLAPIFDLFGEVPVTLDDLREWVASTSPVNLEERFFDNYVRRYNVADKVRAAKRTGDFDRITSEKRPTRLI